MNDFDKEFITELFLDSDSVSTINRLVVAVANVVYENNENACILNEALKEECSDVLQAMTAETITRAPTKPKESYFEDTILKFSDNEYLDQFKIKKSTVQVLIKFLREHGKPDNSVISFEKKVHIFILVMTSELSYNEIGSLFGLHKSSVSYIFYEIASLVTKQKYHFITWPSIEEQHMTRLKVNNRFQFPNCIGFIDTCRFKVGPRRSRRGNLDTILLQAVCDESLLFIDVYVSSTGKLKKNKVFKESQLSHELKNLVDFDNHILGDSEYKLRKNLLTPFTSEELLTSEEMKFNEIHWKARSYIGHAFEVLKERFRKLSHLDVIKHETIESIIFSACILHNFILLHEGCPEIKEESILFDDGVSIDTSIVKTAIEKRQFICNYINYINIDES